jgi:hypothetical protein
MDSTQHACGRLRHLQRCLQDCSRLRQDNQRLRSLLSEPPLDSPSSPRSPQALSPTNSVQRINSGTPKTSLAQVETPVGSPTRECDDMGDDKCDRGHTRR